MKSERVSRPTEIQWTWLIVSHGSPFTTNKDMSELELEEIISFQTQQFSGVSNCFHYYRLTLILRPYQLETFMNVDLVFSQSLIAQFMPLKLMDFVIFSYVSCFPVDII